MRQERPGRIERIARDLGNCAEAWDADACLLGNVTAEEIRDLCQWVIEPNNAVRVGGTPYPPRVGSPLDSER
jgi:hypothetical protein